MTIFSEIPKRAKAIVAITATLISTTAIATSPALADEYKFSPGSMCQHSTPSDLPKLVRGANYIYNSSSSYAYVACPIEWGVPDDSKNRGPYVNINVLKYNTQQLTCYLGSYDGSGGRANSKTASSSATGYTSLTTSRVNSGVVYGIFCHLPPSSGIYSYYTWF